MPTQSEDIKLLSLVELLSHNEQYVIPVYQRNYAWEAKEIEQFIQDIIDYSIHYPDRSYYIGTLIVAIGQDDGKTCFNIIDGQQRLTTLSILSAAIKNEYEEVDLDWFGSLNLRYASREKSTLSMNTVFNGVFEDKEYQLNTKATYDVNIKAAYDICSKELRKRIIENKIAITDFIDYLYHYVKVLRVPLPEGIDLNHYFEIMNSRGEQLEKHEILKARLIACFNIVEDSLRDKYAHCFNLIWEACSNMEKYIQYGFTIEQRDLIFGEKNWDTLTIYDFDEFVIKLGPTLLNNANTVALSIDQIIGGETLLNREEADTDAPDKFNSVVNFPNFLLHVLRLQLGKGEVALDDKRLIAIFENELQGEEDERLMFAKDFIYHLLKSKFLFDKYIIKREFTGNTDRWSMKSLRWYGSGKVKNGSKYTNTFGAEHSDLMDGDNRQLVMLLSMFHVSMPSMSYKYWLNASLYYLFQQIDVDSKDYIAYLEHIAKSFVFDRYLAKHPREYFEMIYESETPRHRTVDQLNPGKLEYGQIENNLVFNFLDYLLWLELKDKESDPRIKAFEYTFRSSVEHYYPQHPINKDVDTIDDTDLHSFGNLCLISHEKNSRLNNHSPVAKKDYYGKSATLDSLKQFLMISKDVWSASEIGAHNDDMIDLFCRNLNSAFSHNNDDVSIARKWFQEFQVRDKVLLVRALLCFGDCTKPMNADRYDLFDFHYIRESETFKEFERYIVEKSPKDLGEIIHRHLAKESLKMSDMYLFIKYPEVITYCKEGIIVWFQDGRLVYLLEGEKNTKYRAKELYTYLVQRYFLQAFDIHLYCDNEYLVINIEYDNGEYFITKTKGLFELYIWNKDGIHLGHSLETELNGNANAVKLLEEYKWTKNKEGNFERFGKSELVKLGDDFGGNVSNSVKEVIKLLKNGLHIKNERSWDS